MLYRYILYSMPVVFMIYYLIQAFRHEAYVWFALLLLAVITIITYAFIYKKRNKIVILDDGIHFKNRFISFENMTLFEHEASETVVTSDVSYYVIHYVDDKGKKRKTRINLEFYDINDLDFVVKLLKTKRVKKKK